VIVSIAFLFFCHFKIFKKWALLLAEFKLTWILTVT